MAEGVQLAIPPSSMSERLTHYQGRNLTAGIRPEDLEISLSDFGDGSISGQVDVIEPTGSEILVYVTLNSTEQTIVCRVDSGQNCSIGDRVALILPLSYKIESAKQYLHFFDNDTGPRLN